MTASKRYLQELRKALPRGLRRRFVAEFRTHLSDGIAAEMARGMEREEAERVTIERLGPPERFAAQFAPTERLVGKRVAIAAAVVLLVAAILAVTSISHTNHARTGTEQTSGVSPEALQTMRSANRMAVQQVVFAAGAHVVLQPRTGLVVHMVSGRIAQVQFSPLHR